jgi:hypothetical protein
MKVALPGICRWLVVAAWVAGPAQAVPLTPGNLVVSGGARGQLIYRINEYGPDRVLVQWVSPEAPLGNADLLEPRDIVIGADGLLHVFNGRDKQAFLSTYDPADGSWSHVTHPEWTGSRTAGEGGIARVGSTVFVTDGEWWGDASGIIAFDLALGTATRFATNLDPFDLTLGLDGSLWALSGDAAYAFDPATFAARGSVSLAAVEDPMGLVVDAGGDLFVANYEGEVVHLSAVGAHLAARDFTDVGPLLDIDIAPGGLIAVSSWVDDTVLTDTRFSFVRGIEGHRWESFVAFVPVPEPSVIVLFAAGCILETWRRRARA